MGRPVTHRYLDPLDAVWLAAAERMGLRVERTPDVYASTDGRGILLIGTDETLDPDDCLAQMIFHELCHWLVQGEESRAVEDWGLDNQTDRDLAREHACLRVQAALSAPRGLRWVLAPTTDHRSYYDALGDDALAPRGEASSVLAIQALARVRRPPWGPHLERALDATAAIVHATASVTSDGVAPSSAPSLLERAEPERGRHPLGPFLLRAVAPEGAAGEAAEAPGASATCAECAWRFRGGRGRAVDRCRQADDARVDPGWPACERFERADDVDCRSCGACCREAYGAVIVGPRERVVRRHPDLVVRDGDTLLLRRAGPRCAALEGGRAPHEPYACRIYDDRPRPCSDLERTGEHCLTARRRVGLSLG